MFGKFLRRRLERQHAKKHEAELTPEQKKFRLFKRTLLSVIAIALLSVGTVAAVRYRDEGSFTVDTPGTETSSTPEVTSTETVDTRVASPLDGTLVSPEVAARRPLAIMIENHPEARPQWGLSSASIVYEAVTEGGITRFMAVFGGGGGAKIGPVRSARPYYLGWALEYDAGYGHVGGSSVALAKIKELHVNDLDQFSVGAKAYRREPHDGVALEHTMYTDTDKLWTVANDKFGSEIDRPTIKFKEPFAREHRAASQKVSVNFSSAQYNTTWNFDPETNRYLRSMAGSLHKDSATGSTIAADTLIVQKVRRLSVDAMETVGSGNADVFMDGKRIEATWKKTSNTAPTVFYDATGAEISRNPGLTWISIIDPNTMSMTVSE